MSAFQFIITAIISSVATFTAPKIIARYRRFKRVKKQKLNELIRAEVEKQLKNIIND
jgi:hypothetical protein